LTTISSSSTSISYTKERRLTPNSRNIHQHWIPLGPGLGCAGLLYLDGQKLQQQPPPLEDDEDVEEDGDDDSDESDSSNLLREDSSNSYSPLVDHQGSPRAFAPESPGTPSSQPPPLTTAHEDDADDPPSTTFEEKVQAYG